MGARRSARWLSASCGGRFGGDCIRVRQGGVWPASSATTGSATIVKELTDKRSEYSTTYLLSNGQLRTVFSLPRLLPGRQGRLASDQHQLQPLSGYGGDRLCGHRLSAQGHPGRGDTRPGAGDCASRLGRALARSSRCHREQPRRCGNSGLYAAVEPSTDSLTRPPATASKRHCRSPRRSRHTRLASSSRTPA